MNEAPQVQEELVEDLIGEDLQDDTDFYTAALNSTNTLHDRYQFESKFDFAIDPEQNEDKSYQIDIFFFIPKSMGVNSDSFPRERFFANLTHYVRVHTPQPAAREWLHPSNWRLASLDRYFEVHLETLKRQRLAELVIQDVKLLGCLVYNEYKRLQRDFVRAFANSTDSALERRCQLLARQLDTLDTIMARYRSLYIEQATGKLILLDEDVKRALLLVDEYLSYRCESALIKLLRVLEENGDVYDLHRRISEMLMREVNYRRGQELVHLDERGVRKSKDVEAARQEMHYYRLGLLKKYVSEVLFLQTANVKKDKVYKNAVGAVGAALAAIWATLAQVQTAQMVNGQGDNSLRLMLVLLLGVVAYVFKDRIKELSKEYFNERMKHKIPDFEMTVHYPHIDEHGNHQREHVGLSQEFLRYLSRPSLPPEIEYLREVGHRAELEPERKETIIHYCKKISFNLPPFRERLSHVRRVHDVVRFDISEFLHKLSDPHKTLSHYDPQKGVVTTQAPKVYHLNVIYRYSITLGDGEKQTQQQVETERIRLIMNKKGILRVEEVVPRGELGYIEDGL